MPLESCMLVIDNSEYMRNGDYPPSRFSAQTDAITVVFSQKVESNPENTAGVMTMAGKSPEVLVTPTQDIGKILSALHNTKLAGTIDLVTSIQVAQLALKHRQNKNLRQRIIVFVGSPIDEVLDDKVLTRLGKKLKKNNVALDIVAFGEFEGNESRLKALVDSVQNSENSHLLTIPPSSNLLSDVLIISPILRDPDAAVPGGLGDAGAGGAAGGSGGGEGFDFGFDPSLDPELALALRMSMEEEQARQRAVGPSGDASTSAAAAASSSAMIPNTEGETTPKAETKPLLAADDDDEEDAELAKAIALSSKPGETKDEEMEDDEEGEDDEEEDEDMTEEEAIARAIAMSMKGEGADEEMDDADKGKK